MVNQSPLHERFLYCNKIFKKNKVVTGKMSFHFVLPILFFLILAFGRAVLYGNIPFSISVLSTKKRYSSFLRKVFIFQKIYFKVKVLKYFKICRDCHIETYRPLKLWAILKIPRSAFQNRTSKKKRFQVLKQKTNSKFAAKVAERATNDCLFI